MIVQNFTNIVDMSSLTTPFLSLFFIIFLIGIMLLCYAKFRIMLLVLVIYLFSLIIGVMFLEIDGIPFTPYIQIFFILFQTSVFIAVSIDFYENVKR